MNTKKISDLPASETINDTDGVLITQGGSAKMARVSALKEYIGKASGAAALGVPVPTAADAGKVPMVTAAGNGYELGVGGLVEYTHEKNGTVHNFTGTGAGGCVKMTADVAAGDTVAVNGVAVPAYVGVDAFGAALAGASVTGRWMTFVFDGSQINFKAGGVPASVKKALTPENIMAGAEFDFLGQTITGALLIGDALYWAGTVSKNTYTKDFSGARTNAFFELQADGTAKALRTMTVRVMAISGSSYSQVRLIVEKSSGSSTTEITGATSQIKDINLEKDDVLILKTYGTSASTRVSGIFVYPLSIA